jgi:hypothetical protein
MNQEQELLEVLQLHLDLERPEVVSKEAILKALEWRISQLLQQNSSTFFQLMYRLDVSERKLIRALADRENGVKNVALLVFERQIQKIHSRRRFPPASSEDEELSW